MNQISFTLIFLFFATLVSAQYGAQYTHFLFNKQAFNPATVGSNEALSIAALYRHQWQGVVGAPRTATLYGDGTFFHNRGGLGLALTSDRIGMVHSIQTRLNYAYRIPLPNASTLSLGLGIQFENARLDWSKAELLDIQDPNLPRDASSQSGFNFGMGLYYQSRRFYVGFSAPTLLKEAIYSDALFGINAVKDLRPYYLMTGLMIDLNEKISMQPGILLTYIPNAPFDADFHLGFLFSDTFWIGGSYRLDDSAAGILQFRVSRQLKIGAAYDYTLSELSDYSKGSFEVMLQYIFDFENEQVNNIRFF